MPGRVQDQFHLLLAPALLHEPHEADRHRHDAGTAFSHPLVLPADAAPSGITLKEMARQFAAFSVGHRNGAPPQHEHIRTLYFDYARESIEFEVDQGTVLYLPIIFFDNSKPTIGDFPHHVLDHHELLHYWYSQSQLGMVAAEIIIARQVCRVGPDYLIGASFPGNELQDGASQYAALAAFVAPLPAGQHRVGFHVKATGQALQQQAVAELFPDGVLEGSLTFEVTVH